MIWCSDSVSDIVDGFAGHERGARTAGIFGALNKNFPWLINSLIDQR